MSFTTRASSQVLVLAGLLLAGCAGDGSDNFFTTGALGTAETAAAPEPKVDPACVSLVSRIEALRKEGVADKIEKAAAKKYKMTQRGPGQGRSADQGQRRLPAALLDDHAEADCRPSARRLRVDAGRRLPPAAKARRRRRQPRSPHRPARELAPRRTWWLRCVAAQALAEPVAHRRAQPADSLQHRCGQRNARGTAVAASSLVLLQSCHTAFRAVEIIAALCFVGLAAHGRSEEALVARTVSTEHLRALALSLAALRWPRAQSGGGYGGDPGASRWRRARAAGRSGRSSTSSTGGARRGRSRRRARARSSPPKDKADVDRYNSLLNQYLGARCHV